ncbi:hypothetical protein MYX06_03620 [Patescibacteria group bacterium AH-259-L05]|nr:hypothetical protein [Patescibacteria group bacterium AH-259-L05]
MTKTQNSNKDSQSLIETIVAVGIIMVAIVAILGVGLTHLRLGGESEFRVSAINLSREGAELAITTRNSNQLNPSNSWPYGLTPNDDYIVDYNDTSFTAATFSGSEVIADCTNCYLCRDGSSDYYYSCATIGTLFRRMVTIADGDALGGNCSANCEKTITSTVYWVDRSGSHTLSTEVRLTDWR